MHYSNLQDTAAEDESKWIRNIQFLITDVLLEKRGYSERFQNFSTTVHEQISRLFRRSFFITF
jgi:hypothetical protein